MTNHATDQSTDRLTDRTTDLTGEGVYTLAAAAALTGMTTEALRLRLRRGVLRKAWKGNDGRIRIKLPAEELSALKGGRPFSRPADAGQRPTERATENSFAVKALADAVAVLKEELAAARSRQAADAEERTRVARRLEELEATLAAAQRAQAAAEAVAATERQTADRLRGELEEASRKLAAAQRRGILRRFWRRSETV